MTQLTEHFGLMRLGAGDQLSANGYQFTDADRVLLDRLLYLASGGHHHTGASSGTSDPGSAPALTLQTTGGALPAGARVYYKLTYVDVSGNETAPSPETYIDMPAPVVSPSPASITTTTTGGTLQPGVYFYVLSAYYPTTTIETKATNVASTTIPIGTTTNKITLTLPSLPSGANGYNVYRLKPGGARYLYVASIPMNVATPPATFVDDGSLTEDCDRTLPAQNNTRSANQVTVSVPGGVVPPGFTWKLYRTLVTNFYTNSLLHWVVEETTEGSGIVRPTWVDVGSATITGQPPNTNQQIYASPAKVNLQDGLEVQGKLPLARVSAFPYQVTFAFDGQLFTQVGASMWVCEFPQARIASCRATLGIGAIPSTQSLIVDVNKGSGNTPAPTTVFTTQANRPQISTARTVGALAVPNIVELVTGDVLTVDIDQLGTNTSSMKNLTVQINLFVYGYTAPASFS